MNGCINYNQNVAYDNPDKVPCIDIAFKIVINPCEIVSFTSDSLLIDEDYIIYEDFATVIQKQIPTFTQVPTCEYNIAMSATIEQTTPGPALNAPTWGSPAQQPLSHSYL